MKFLGANSIRCQEKKEVRIRSNGHRKVDQTQFRPVVLKKVAMCLRRICWSFCAKMFATGPEDHLENRNWFYV